MSRQGGSDNCLPDRIRQTIRRGEYGLSRHATEQRLARQITEAEILEALDNCFVIEDYPDDKYGPSCLILGHTKAGRSLHVHCSYPGRPLIKIITLYEPDPNVWADLRVRKQGG